MTNSIVDKLTTKLAPVYHKLNDHAVGNLLGTECKVLRITKTPIDVMGESRESVSASVIDNVIITHPYSGSVQLFETYNDITKQLNTGSIDIWDVLPITMKIKLSGDTNNKAVAVKRDDLIIEILKDQHGNKIPLIMQVTKIFGSFFVKTLVAQKYELTLYRGALATSIRTAIDNFLKED